MLERLVLAQRNVINKQQVDLWILANFLGILAHCAPVGRHNQQSTRRQKLLPSGTFRRKPGFRQSLAQRPHAKNTTNTPNEILRHPPITPTMPLPNNNMQQWNFLPNPYAFGSSTRQHPRSDPLHANFTAKNLNIVGTLKDRICLKNILMKMMQKLWLYVIPYKKPLLLLKYHCLGLHNFFECSSSVPVINCEWLAHTFKKYL